MCDNDYLKNLLNDRNHSDKNTDFSQLLFRHLKGCSENDFNFMNRKENHVTILLHVFLLLFLHQTLHKVSQFKKKKIRFLFLSVIFFSHFSKSFLEKISQKITCLGGGNE